MDRRTVLKWIGLCSLASTFAPAWKQSSDRLDAQPTGIVYYVSPGGNDSWSGKQATPNLLKTDGPFATLERARDAIRLLKRQQSNGLEQYITVLVRGGTYFLKKPLVLTAEDSGTVEFPIAWRAYRDEKPIISGGRLLRDWQEVTVRGKTLWLTEIPEVQQGNWYFRQLWVNGKLRSRARYPNQGYLKVAQVPDATAETKWNEGQMRFGFEEGDLTAWGEIAEAEAIVMNRWVESRLPVRGLDETKRLISFSKKSQWQLEQGDLYYLENAFEFLDSPGEWYLERKTGKLYYWPELDEKINTAEIIAPVLSQTMQLKGKPEKEEFVERISFRDLTWSHTKWYYSENAKKRSFGQAAKGVPGAVKGVGVRYCNFNNCTFARIGNYALQLERGCQYNRIIGCQMFDLGAGGIKIGERGRTLKPTIRENKLEQNYRNQILDCHIYDGGRLFHSAVAILIAQSYENRIAYNRIHDFYYTGISVGWRWNYGRSLAYGNVVEFNHIHHIGALSNGDGPILSDMGAIYTLGVQPGTIIRANLCQDIAGIRYGGWGIYLDQASSGLLVENNIVSRTTHGGFSLHFGKDNILRNNIFAFGGQAQLLRTRPEEYLSFTFEQNIIYWSGDGLLQGRWKDYNFIFDRNLYWRADEGEIEFAIDSWEDKENKLSWQEWQQKGMDRNSAIADPLFIDPERGDFRLKPNSPAFELGFEPISLERTISPEGAKLLNR